MNLVIFYEARTYGARVTCAAVQMTKNMKQPARTLIAYAVINPRRRQRQQRNRHIAARACRAETLGTCQGVTARTHRAITSTVAVRAATTASFGAAAVTNRAHTTCAIAVTRAHGSVSAPRQHPSQARRQCETNHRRAQPRTRWQVGAALKQHATGKGS